MSIKHFVASILLLLLPNILLLLAKKLVEYITESKLLRFKLAVATVVNTSIHYRLARYNAIARAGEIIQ